MNALERAARDYRELWLRYERLNDAEDWDPMSDVMLAMRRARARLFKAIESSKSTQATHGDHMATTTRNTTTTGSKAITRARSLLEMLFRVGAIPREYRTDANETIDMLKKADARTRLDPSARKRSAKKPAKRAVIAKRAR